METPALTRIAEHLAPLALGPEGTPKWATRFHAIHSVEAPEVADLAARLTTRFDKGDALLLADDLTTRTGGIENARKVVSVAEAIAERGSVAPAEAVTVAENAVATFGDEAPRIADIGADIKAALAVDIDPAVAWGAKLVRDYGDDAEAVATLAKTSEATSGVLALQNAIQAFTPETAAAMRPLKKLGLTSSEAVRWVASGGEARPQTVAAAQILREDLALAPNEALSWGGLLTRDSASGAEDAARTARRVHSEFGETTERSLEWAQRLHRDHSVGAPAVLRTASLLKGQLGIAGSAALSEAEKLAVAADKRYSVDELVTLASGLHTRLGAEPDLALNSVGRWLGGMDGDAGLVNSAITTRAVKAPTPLTSAAG